MTLSQLPETVLARIRWLAPRCLLAAGPVLGLGLWSLAWHQEATSPLLPQEQAVTPGAILDDIAWAAGVESQWPVGLEAAAGMFQCWPTTGMHESNSLIVWTNKAHHVIAFSPTVSHAPLPAFAATIGRGRAVPMWQQVRVAEPGYVMRVGGTEFGLQLKNTELVCVRTWDD